MSDAGWNMYVFRDGRQRVTGSELIGSLTLALCRWQNAPEHTSDDCVLAALIAAGELECALLDDAGESADSCKAASEITEALAASFLTGQKHSHSSIVQKVERLRVSSGYEVSVQEGFAYYALHPLKVALLLDKLALKPRMAVLGIRSIGVTLSAVAQAALKLRGVECQRITVRPTGHPYNRTLALTPECRQWVAALRGASFLIVDEGPGISGSSFLAVAEALLECGMDHEQIDLIGSREVDAATLRAADAGARWSRFRFHVMQCAPLPPAEASVSLSGGTWRRHFPCEESAMPATWAPLEPAKFLACNERSVFRFEGFGHYGEAVGARAALLAKHGLSPRYYGNRCGFGEYELVRGRRLELCDRSLEVLERMTEYLALRGTAFACAAAQTPELEKMLRWNWQVEFGEELRQDESQLHAERVVVCDGRMMPHEWLRSDGGELLKLDACSHGDNHFFPGPCDIAWDVAGTMVEWEMRGEMRERFVGLYEARTGDKIRNRLGPYLLAYTAFQLGWCRMAALAMQGEYDEALLLRDYRRYRAVALELRRMAKAA